MNNWPKLIIILVFIILATLYLSSCTDSQTPYMAQKELKYWIKVGDTLVDKEWHTDTIIITRINSDSSRVRGIRAGSGFKFYDNKIIYEDEIMDYVPLYRNYINLSNPNFKVSKPISIL